MALGVGDAVGVGEGVGTGERGGVGTGVRVATGVGEAVGEAVGVGEGTDVGVGDGNGVEVEVGVSAGTVRAVGTAGSGETRDLESRRSGGSAVMAKRDRPGEMDSYLTASPSRPVALVGSTVQPFEYRSREISPSV